MDKTPVTLSGMNFSPGLHRRGFLLGALAVAAGGVGCSPGKGMPLIATDSQPRGYPTVAALEHFARDLERRTDGRLRTTVYPGGQLGSQNDTLELAQFGGVDFIRVNVAPLNVLVPETVVPALPFLFRSTAHMRTALDGAPGDALLAALEPYGLIGLAFYDSGARSMYTTRRLIHHPDDLNGLKIRVQTSELFVSMVEALGGDATPMAYGEVYQGLMQGVIDGAENNWPSYESSRHFEVARYYSETRHVMAPEVLAMSRYRWERLSTDDQQHVRSAARDSVAVMRTLWDARESTARAAVLAAGVEVTRDIDQPAFVARVEPLWSEYLPTRALRRLVEDIQSSGDAGA